MTTLIFFSLVFLRSKKDLEKLIVCWELIMFLSFLIYCTKHDGIQSSIRKIQMCLERHLHSVWGAIAVSIATVLWNFAITGRLWHVSLQENHRLLESMWEVLNNFFLSVFHEELGMSTFCAHLGFIPCSMFSLSKQGPLVSMLLIGRGGSLKQNIFCFLVYSQWLSFTTVMTARKWHCSLCLVL